MKSSKGVIPLHDIYVCVWLAYHFVLATKPKKLLQDKLRQVYAAFYFVPQNIPYHVSDFKDLRHIFLKTKQLTLHVTLILKFFINIHIYI